MRCFFKENIYAWARHQIQGLIDMGKEVEVLLCHFVQGPIVHTEPLLLAVLLRDQDHSWQPRAVGRFDYACLQHGTLIGIPSVNMVLNQMCKAHLIEGKYVLIFPQNMPQFQLLVVIQTITVPFPYAPAENITNQDRNVASVTDLIEANQFDKNSKNLQIFQ